VDANLLLALFSSLDHFQNSPQLVGEALVRIFNWPHQSLDETQQTALTKCVEYLLKEYKDFTTANSELKTVQGWAFPSASASSSATSTSKAKKTLTEPIETQLFRRAPVILILDKHCQVFPWESIPILQSYPVSRMPSLAMIRARLLQGIRYAIALNMF